MVYPGARLRRPVRLVVRLTRATFFSFAMTLAVFAVWALYELPRPVTPGPYAFNVLSKLLAFATVLTFFLPPRVLSKTPKQEKEMVIKNDKT